MTRSTQLLLGLFALASCGPAPKTHTAPATLPVEAAPPVPEEAEEAEEPERPPRHSEARTTNGADRLTLVAASFADLPGWRQDQHGAAIGAFRASCEKLVAFADDEPIGSGPYGGTGSAWRDACHEAQNISKSQHKRARAFFEKHFRAYEANGTAGPDGRITGYYVQPLRASRKRGGRYQFPLYKRPSDLVAVKLDDFVEDGRSRRVWGRINTASGKLVPYPTRSEFESELGESPDDAVLLWLDSPADVVLVEIEGSGRARLPDGSDVMVAFAGKNGRTSGRRGTARRLRKVEKAHRGRRWSDAALAKVRRITQEKDSMVFFEIESRPGAIGSQNVVLTPRRSLAVDRAVIPLGTPVWVDTRVPDASGAEAGPWRHLVIAQDTGGAIIGPVRGDVYFGDDANAVAIGRRVNGPGRMWLLLPVSAPPPARPPAPPPAPSTDTE